MRRIFAVKLLRRAVLLRKLHVIMQYVERAASCLRARRVTWSQALLAASARCVSVDRLACLRALCVRYIQREREREREKEKERETYIYVWLRDT